MKENTKFGLTFVGIFFAVLIGITGLTWFATGNDFFLYKFFAPKQEAVRREVFEQSKAYRQGMIQELQNMEFQYVQANDDQKQALASIILHRVADFDVDSLPYGLHTFIDELRSQKGVR